MGKLTKAGAMLLADPIMVEHLEMLERREVKQHHDEQHLSSTLAIFDPLSCWTWLVARSLATASRLVFEAAVDPLMPAHQYGLYGRAPFPTRPGTPPDTLKMPRVVLNRWTDPTCYPPKTAKVELSRPFPMRLRLPAEQNA